MTEEKWHNSRWVEDVLDCARQYASSRKVSLFQIACTYIAATNLPSDSRFHQLIVETERWAESIGGEQPEIELELIRTDEVANQRLFELLTESRGKLRHSIRLPACEALITRFCCEIVTESDWWRVTTDIDDEIVDKHHSLIERERERICTANIHLLRCVVGNPFRPVMFDPEWRTSTVFALAEGIYAERAFDRLPILADALEEAGCDHAEMLSHCRGPAPHARGCWVVDLVLGKT